MSTKIINALEWQKVTNILQQTDKTETQMEAIYWNLSSNS